MIRRLLVSTVALSAALAVAACGERNEGVEDGAVESASAESGVGSNPLSNTVQDAASGMVGAVSAAAARTADLYVPAAAISDMYEIESSRIALERSQNADVKRFAQTMIDHHTKTTATLKQAAGGADVQLPTAMDERRQGLVDNLRQAPAGGFDGVYKAQQIAAHEEALTLHRTYAEHGENAALKAAATAAVPIVEQHLTAARALPEGGQAAAGSAGAAGKR
jgi:putative membrane protein